MMERIPWENLVQAPVEWLFVLPGNHRLVSPSIVHINNITTRDSRMKQDLVVWRPVSASLKLPGNDYAHEKDRCNCQECPPGAKQKDWHRQSCEPHKWRQGKIRHNREASNSRKATGDVKGICSKRLYLHEQLTKRAG